jgi:aminocarboxymuconate-semialdehyde decarboxylase
MIVDAHSHIVPPGQETMPDLGGRQPQAYMRDVDRLFRLQDEGGVDRTVLSIPTLVEHSLKESPEAALEAIRRCHDYYAELVARHPQRLAALATTWPQGGDPFLREFERAVRDLGLRGVLVNPRYGDQYLDDPAADDFLALACALDVPVYVHPPGVTFIREHLPRYRLMEAIGRPVETAVGLARLILYGVLDRHPTLQVVGAHVGGALTSVFGRLEYSFELRDTAQYEWAPPRIERPPSEYARRMWADTVTFWGPALRAAVDTFGVEHMLLGSDTPPLPFPLRKSIAMVEALGLSPEEQAGVLGENAVRLFRLDGTANA